MKGAEGRFGIARVALVTLAIITTACTTTLPRMNVLGKREGTTEPGTYLGLPLKTGQLVLTESPDATSFLFPLIPKEFHPFTHVAILAIEDGEPWVYDVTGEVKTFPLKKRLLANVQGKMYRRRLYEYVAPNLYAEVYDPPEGADGDKIAAFARQKLREGVEFDPYFDFGDHSKLFCTELVELAIRSAGGPARELESTNPNPSIVEGMKWLGVPPGVALPVGNYADPKRFVAAFGQFPTRTAAWSYFEAKREIHRRFSPDQRLGYVLSIDGRGRIDVRPEISAFAVQASHLFDGEETPPPPGDPRIAAAVRKLAEQTFGPFGEPGGPSGEPKAVSVLGRSDRERVVSAARSVR